MNSSSSIGACLFAIGSDEIDLWPQEKAIKRIEEDIGSLFSHAKLAMAPFGSILIIPTGDTSWLTNKISLKSVAAEVGMDYRGRDRFGRIRLDWNPPVPKVDSTPLLKLPSEEDFISEAGRLSFSQLLTDALSKKRHKIMLRSSRLEAARKQKSNTTKKRSKKKKSAPSQSPQDSSTEQCPDSLNSVHVSSQETWSADSEMGATGPLTGHCNSSKSLCCGSGTPGTQPDTGSMCDLT